MRLGTLRGGPGSWLLLPGSRRATGIGLLIVCLAAFLAAFLGGRASAGGLDAVIDPRIQVALSRFPALLNWLPDLGTLGPVALMTLVLVLACVAARRWTGAVLAAIAVPGATGLTEYVLKPSVGASLGQGFPSGHATSSFALAVCCAVLLAGPPYHSAVGTLRLLVVLAALLLAAAVAAAMIAIGAHVFTDAVAGAAVGTGVVLACALTLDAVVTRARLVPARSDQEGGDGWRGS
jgi:membrane-associated phospholipid phosphatase